MGVRFLLIDEEKKIFSMLGDIFDVTSHKLLVAFDKQKAKELLNTAPFDIMLIQPKHFEFWLNAIKEEKWVLPLFILEDYDYAEHLKALGFTELNYVVLPFNPLDLLTKAVWLNRENMDPKAISLLGPVNLILHLLRRKASAVVSVKDNAKKCSIYLRGGLISGISCNIEELKTLFASDSVNIELYPYKDDDYLEFSFEKNEDFFFELFSAAIQSYVEEELPKVQEGVKTATIDLAQPIEVSEGLFWVGFCDEKRFKQSNSYLRIYGKDDLRLPILVGLGDPESYIRTKNKIEEVLSTTDLLKAIVVMNSLEVFNAIRIAQSNPRVQIITSLDIAKTLQSIGIPTSRIRLVESLPQLTLKLSTGETLRIIPTPFAPEKDSFVVYEESTGILFTSHLFSSLYVPEKFSLFEDGNVEDVLLYAIHSMPCSKALHQVINSIEGLDVKLVLPAFGNPIRGESLRKVIANLQSAKVGVDVPIRDIDLQRVINVWENLRKSLDEKEFLRLREEMEQYALFEEDRLIDTPLSPYALAKLLTYKMQEVGISSKFIKDVMKELYIFNL